MITREDVITASGTYPERAKSPELTQEVLDNIDELLRRVNPLLERLGIKNAKVTSGFRPSGVNSKVGATKSAHVTGEALDILDDKGQSLAKSITRALLEEFDLYREDSDHTIGKYTNWCHLSTRKTKSGKRIFIP